MYRNPFIDFNQLPNFAEITPAQTTAAVDRVLADALKETEFAATGGNADWETVVAPLERADENISRVWNQVEQMHAVMNSAAWRDTYQQNLQKIVAHYAVLGQDQRLYARLRALADSPAFAALTPARQKIVNDGMTDFELSGVALPPPQKEIFRKNSERLAMLAAKFEENLLAATNDFSLTVTNRDDLGDMPDDMLATAADGDGWHFTLQPPSYKAFITHAASPALREKMYRAYNTRASELDEQTRDNTPLIAEILKKREQQATLLGFNHYAEMALQKRMAASVADVDDFLRDLVRRAKPHALRELADLRRFAADELGIPDLRAWDTAFAAEKLRQRRFDFSDAQLRAYLREDKVLEGLFSCVRRLFNISLRRAEAPLWNDDARYYELLSPQNEVIGGLYLDLYSRETKHGGAWMADALSRCRRHGRVQLPLAHIVCNFSKPIAGAPALMDWDEMTTLFHECGHALHHLLTEMEDYSVSGISGVEWDAVELPSQWLENFVWDWRVLQPMTAHVDSGEPMPRQLFDKVNEARRFHSGLWLMRQLELALFDLGMHQGPPRPYLETLAAVRELTAVMPSPADNRFPCGFSHIFAGGYAAGYYSYLWAEMLSADIFSLFAEADDVLDPVLGATFRKEVLAVGGSRAAMDSFIAVRGRKPDKAMLLAHHGLPAQE